VEIDGVEGEREREREKSGLRCGARFWVSMGSEMGFHEDAPPGLVRASTRVIQEKKALRLAPRVTFPRVFFFLLLDKEECLFLQNLCFLF
jgi:hypothetical protein